MEHSTTPEFWRCYAALPSDIQARADKQFELLKADPHHPSIRLKKIGERDGSEVWSSRVTLNYRALAIKRPNGYLWFWIGNHNAYDERITN